jgi:hypothetical protein
MSAGREMKRKEKGKEPKVRFASVDGGRQLNSNCPSRVALQLRPTLRQPPSLYQYQCLVYSTLFSNVKMYNECTLSSDIDPKKRYKKNSEPYTHPNSRFDNFDSP